MDVSDLKGRIAEALVESIFRRASYRVARVGRESQVQGLLKVGTAEFSPDFLVWKEVPGARPEQHRHRLLAIEVKYRSNLREFLRRDIDPLVSRVRDQWPELYYIFVTDNPETDRSCFQVFGVKDHTPGAAPLLVDLHHVPDWDIFRTTIQEYERLVREIFGLLNTYRSEDSPTPRRGDLSRRPPVGEEARCMGPDGSTIQAVLEHQRTWAERERIGLRDSRHTRRVEDNLYGGCFSAAARQEFKAAAGHELGDPKHPESPAGLSALLSSAALVYNVFDYWRERDKSLLAEACGAGSKVSTLALEQQFALWRGGTPPHLDVLLEGPSGLPTAIESKFTEPYQHEAVNEFAATYFDRQSIWQGLRRCCAMAEEIRDGREAFKHLAAAQLLKHALGLTKRYGPQGFRLLYLWYRWPGAEADRHADELERFRGAVGDEVVFETRTYQEVFAVLRRAGSEHADYVNYLGERYFAQP